MNRTNDVWINQENNSAVHEFKSDDDCSDGLGILHSECGLGDPTEKKSASTDFNGTYDTSKVTCKRCIRVRNGKNFSYL